MVRYACVAMSKWSSIDNGSLEQAKRRQQDRHDTAVLQCIRCPGLQCRGLHKSIRFASMEDTVGYVNGIAWSIHRLESPEADCK